MSAFKDFFSSEEEEFSEEEEEELSEEEEEEEEFSEEEEEEGEFSEEEEEEREFVPRLPVPSLRELRQRRGLVQEPLKPTQESVRRPIISREFHRRPIISSPSPKSFVTEPSEEPPTRGPIITRRLASRTTEPSEEPPTREPIITRRLPSRTTEPSEEPPTREPITRRLPSRTTEPSEEPPTREPIITRRLPSRTTEPSEEPPTREPIITRRLPSRTTEPLEEPLTRRPIISSPSPRAIIAEPSEELPTRGPVIPRRTPLRTTTSEVIEESSTQRPIISRRTPSRAIISKPLERPSTQRPIISRATPSRTTERIIRKPTPKPKLRLEIKEPVENSAGFGESSLTPPSSIRGPIITSFSGEPLEVVGPPVLTQLQKSLDELLIKDEDESKEEFNFRKNYTLRIAPIIIAEEAKASTELIVSLGRSKTNKVFRGVTYPYVIINQETGGKEKIELEKFLDYLDKSIA